jgi:hypothetical protein
MFTILGKRMSVISCEGYEFIISDDTITFISISNEKFRDRFLYDDLYSNKFELILADEKSLNFDTGIDNSNTNIINYLITNNIKLTDDLVNHLGNNGAYFVTDLYNYDNTIFNNSLLIAPHINKYSNICTGINFIAFETSERHALDILFIHNRNFYKIHCATSVLCSYRQLSPEEEYTYGLHIKQIQRIII